MSEGKIREARFTLVVSVIIALGINLVATFFTQPLVSIPILVATVAITIYVLAHYSSITTLRARQFATIIVFDGKTGDYPDHVTQTLIRQTVNALAINAPNIKSKILESLSQISHQGNDKTTLIDIAETIILSQLFRTLSFPPSEYMNCVQTTSLPESIRES